MSKSNLKSNIEWLSDPKIAITVAVLVVVAIGIVVFFWDKIKAAIKKGKQDKKNESLYGSATETTDFNALAQQMYKACEGWGTDEDAVKRVLSQIYSNADYAALRSAYAVCDSSYTLDARLQSEGTRKELVQWRAILDANGVNNYQF